MSKLSAVVDFEHNASLEIINLLPGDELIQRPVVITRNGSTLTSVLVVFPEPVTGDELLARMLALGESYGKSHHADGTSVEVFVLSVEGEAISADTQSAIITVGYTMDAKVLSKMNTIVRGDGPVAVICNEFPQRSAGFRSLSALLFLVGYHKPENTDPKLN